MNLNLCLNIASSILFVMYGLLCLTSDRMVQEFDRYGLTKVRVLIGILELCGGFGQGFGYFLYRPLYIFSIAGITALMFLAIILRFRLKDPFLQTIPAIGLFVLNGYLLVQELNY